MQHISATLLETIDAAQDLVDALEHFSDLAKNDADTCLAAESWRRVVEAQRDSVRARLQTAIDNSPRECPR